MVNKSFKKSQITVIPNTIDFISQIMQIYPNLKKSLKKLIRKLSGQEKPLSLIKKNRLTLTERDIILLSYPRSGNTWSRYLIADMILQNLGFNTGTELPVEFSKIIPSIYTHNLETVVDENISLPYRLIKSHEHKDAEKRKFIYIFRNPIDTLCSWYYFLKNNPKPEEAKKVLNKNIGQCCLEHVDYWIQHVEQSLLRYEQDSTEICWLCYEELHKNPHIVLKSVIKFLDLNEHCIEIGKTIENHSFNHQVNLLKNTKQEVQLKYNLRKGKIGSGKETLSEEVQALVNKKTKALYDKAYTSYLEQIVAAGLTPV